MRTLSEFTSYLQGRYKVCSVLGNPQEEENVCKSLITMGGYPMQGKLQLPSIGAFYSNCPQSRAMLLSWVYENYGLKSEEGKTKYSDRELLTFAALQSGIIYGVFITEDGKFKGDYYTANPEIIANLTAEGKKPAVTPESAVKALEKEGKTSALRIDIDSKGNLKLTKPRNILTLYDGALGGNFVPAPVNFAVMSVLYLMDALKFGHVLEVVKDDKKRCITTNKAVLNKYSDDPTFVESLSLSLALATVSVYVPVLGAPSNTLGCTRVDVLDLTSCGVVSQVPDYVTRVTGQEVAFQLALELYRTSLNEKQLMAMEAKLFGKPLAEGEYFGSKLKNKSGMLPFLMADKGVQSSVRPFYEAIESTMPALTGSSSTRILKPSDIGDVDSLKGILKSGVCSIVSKSASGKYRTTIATLNMDIIKELHGESQFFKDTFEFKEEEKTQKQLEAEVKRKATNTANGNVSVMVVGSGWRSVTLKDIQKVICY